LAAPRRTFKKPTPERLANAALYYLSRYAASEASLRRVLENRVRRAAMRDEAFAADREAQAALPPRLTKSWKSTNVQAH
jgi:SOS response regulatory protein OraA/RecX